MKLKDGIAHIVLESYASSDRLGFVILRYELDGYREWLDKRKARENQAF